MATHVVQPGLLRLSLASSEAIDTNGTIMNIIFKATGQTEPIHIQMTRLNDEAGRDLELSALQQVVEVGLCNPINLPFVRK